MKADSAVKDHGQTKRSDELQNMTPLLAIAVPRPRQLAAGGDASASRGLVQLGQGGTAS